MYKILLIEDNKDLLVETIELLEFEGFHVLGAKDGKVGVEIALNQKPDLILCDILMDGIDGYEVRRQIKSNFETERIPFIFLTAIADANDVRKGMEYGADDYLIKPVSVETLKKSINTRLEKAENLKKYTNTRLNELRERIIYALPHELVTPLHAIMGYATIIKDNASEFTLTEVKEFALQIVDSCNRLHNLINNYLKYVAEISVRTDKAILDVVDPKCVIPEIAGHVAKSFMREDDLLLDIDGSILSIELDDLSFVIKEIVDNAFKFSQSNTKVIIKGKATASCYEVSITDFGIGFPHHIITTDQIGAFNQFNRKSQEQQGTGLGLITSLLVIQRYKGTMQFFNNDGTTVLIFLPILN